MSTAVAPEPDTLTRRALWLAERKTLITGTDAAKILGLSKFGGPHDVYLDKTGKLDTKAETEVPTWVMAGRFMERAIIQYYAETVKQPVRFADSYVVQRSPLTPLIGATLDAKREDDGRPVDAKNIRYKTPQWGESGSDIIPPDYVAQGAVQMLVAQSAFFDLPTLFTGQDLHIYTLNRDADLEAQLVETLTKWWETHIVRDTPPALSGSNSSTEYLKRTLFQKTDNTVAASVELCADAATLASLRATRKDIELQEAELENRIKAAIGEAKTVSGTGWHANWSQAKDSKKLDAGKLIERLYQMAAEYHAQVPDALPLPSLATLKDAHAVTTPGSRRFTFYYNGE
jgi:predicted phage-related endonuclease